MDAVASDEDSNTQAVSHVDGPWRRTDHIAERGTGADTVDSESIRMCEEH